MKCKNCTCQVSSDFKHAFATNCCPKCGKFLMDNNVQDLFIKINDLLLSNDNDIGELAYWLVNVYHSTSESSEAPSEASQKLSEEPIEQAESSMQVQEPKKPAHKVQRSSGLNTTADASAKQASNRAALFSKRAGIDKSKYEKLVKDIQNDSMLADESSYMAEDTGEDMVFDPTPLQVEIFNLWRVYLKSPRSR